jgi:hypothetical protein
MSCSAGESQHAPGRFVQDRFVIAMFGDPPLTEADYQLVAEAHFNLVIGNMHADTPERVLKQLDLCERHGLKALVTCGDAAPEDYPEGPACWGYVVRDEPNAAAFPALAERVRALRATRPGRLPMINLLGDYTQLRPADLAARDYDDYVRRFIDVVDPDILSMDYYPYFLPVGDDRDGLCRALDAMRRHSLASARPFWNFINCMPYGPHTDPTEGQLMWQVYTSLAYGSKGIGYFCYFTPVSPEFPKGGAIVTRDNVRTRHWYQARRINEQVQNLGPTLMQLTARAVYRLYPIDDPKRFLRGTGIKNIVHAPVDPPPDYLIGVFEHSDGRRAVMLNNYRFAYTAWPTVEFDVPEASVREVDKWTGAETPVRDDSPEMEGLQVSLDAGEGRLFLLPPDEG